MLSLGHTLCLVCGDIEMCLIKRRVSCTANFLHQPERCLMGGVVLGMGLKNDGNEHY
jgi:hypothetical protein